MLWVIEQEDEMRSLLCRVGRLLLVRPITHTRLPWLRSWQSQWVSPSAKVLVALLKWASLSCIVPAEHTCKQPWPVDSNPASTVVLCASGGIAAMITDLAE